MRAEIEQQFIAAYDTLADPLYRHCLFRVYNSRTAEDIVQECFMKTWSYLAGGKEVDNLKAFLYKVLNNLIIDYSRKKREESLEAVLENNPGQEPSADGRESNETNLLYQDALKAISHLPEDAQTVIIMRYVDGLEPRDIARILDIPANTVSVRLNRAVSSVKDIFNF